MPGIIGGIGILPAIIMEGCSLIQDYNLDCRDSVGGLKEVNFIELANIVEYEEASGVVTSITKASGKRFFKYALVKNTANFEDTLTGNEENGTQYAEQKLNIVLNRMQANTRNEIILLGKNLLVAAVADKNKKKWLLGIENGLSLKTSKGQSGTKPGDRNGYAIEFDGQEELPAFEISDECYETLTTPE